MRVTNAQGREWFVLCRDCHAEVTPEKVGGYRMYRCTSQSCRLYTCLQSGLVLVRNQDWSNRAFRTYDGPMRNPRVDPESQPLE